MLEAVVDTDIPLVGDASKDAPLLCEEADGSSRGIELELAETDTVLMVDDGSLYTVSLEEFDADAMLDVDANKAVGGTLLNTEGLPPS